MSSQYVQWFKHLSRDDVAQVGGKNASLGELINHLDKLQIAVPNGFATTVAAYREFLTCNELDSKIQQALVDIDVDNLPMLQRIASDIRNWIMQAQLPPTLLQAIATAYQQLSHESGTNASFAIRSSATAEDLPNASFAGQQDSYLNVVGIENVYHAIKCVFASLFTDRAIAYRVHHHFAHEQVAISVGVQRMVRSDLASSGVIFTLDTESGFADVVFITAGYGLGELLVQGKINPDEFYVHKATLQAQRPAIVRRSLGSKNQRMIYAPANATETTMITEVSLAEQRQFALNDVEVMQLAQFAVKIAAHYGCHMDIEWAKDGYDGQLYIVQARPETVKSRAQSPVLQRYQLLESSHVISRGRSIGQRIGSGVARIIKSVSELHRVRPGEVLVSDMTDPDWEPVMKRAAGIVTNRGGRTCHAAIIARELGIPAVVGCGDATRSIKDGELVTVSCAEGDEGLVYQGELDYKIHEIAVDNMPKLPVKVMLNVANPERAFTFQSLPNAGVGLARVEFIINNTIGIHPKALLHYETLPQSLQEQIQQKILAYASPTEYYISKLSEGVACIAAAFIGKPVIVRLSDFKSNEYSHLLGGELYEPHEENPMLGFRGAARYIAPEFLDCLALELAAIKRVREDMGFTNVEIMVPFVRTVTEAKNVIEILANHGLVRGENGLRVIMMCEIPSNALLAADFLEYFDGFSIGSNDLTQLTLGLDRDSALIAAQFDERDPAVKQLLSLAIKACKSAKKYVGICGQGPSDHPDFAQWLMAEGIDSISLNPDTVIDTVMFLAK